MPEKVLHCWMGKTEYMEEVHGFGSQEWADSVSEPSATCMLEKNHEGPHEWTLDGEIVISFPPKEEESDG